MKAILVFDIHELTYKAIKECFVKTIDLHLRDNGFITIENAELKLLPQEKKTDIVSFTGLCEQYRKVGWNDCLDEILGDNDE